MLNEPECEVSDECKTTRDMEDGVKVASEGQPVASGNRQVTGENENSPKLESASAQVEVEAASEQLASIEVESDQFEGADVSTAIENETETSEPNPTKLPKLAREIPEIVNILSDLLFPKLKLTSFDKFPVVSKWMSTGGVEVPGFDKDDPSMHEDVGFITYGGFIVTVLVISYIRLFNSIY